MIEVLGVVLPLINMRRARSWIAGHVARYMPHSPVAETTSNVWLCDSSELCSNCAFPQGASEACVVCDAKPACTAYQGPCGHVFCYVCLYDSASVWPVSVPSMAT